MISPGLTLGPMLMYEIQPVFYAHFLALQEDVQTTVLPFLWLGLVPCWVIDLTKQFVIIFRQVFQSKSGLLLALKPVASRTVKVEGSWDRVQLDKKLPKLWLLPVIRWMSFLTFEGTETVIFGLISCERCCVGLLTF